MTGDYKDLCKSVDKVSGAVSSLSKEESRRARAMGGPLGIQVEELSALISAGDESRREYAQRRMAESREVAGMYEEMMALGLVSMSGTMSGRVFIEVTPLGHWAVQRHEIEQSQAASAEKSSRMHDLRMAIVGGVFGLVGVVLGFVLGVVSGLA